MQLQIYKNRGLEYVRIVESYRDPENKKPKLRVIENFGNKERLLNSNPNALEELEHKVHKMNDEKAQLNSIELSKRLELYLQSGDSQESQQGALLKNYGFEIYKMIWNELNLDYFFKYRQKQHTNIRFPTQVPISLMTYSRLLKPCSKRSTYEGKDDFAHSFACEQEHMYRSLSFLAEQKQNLETYLHKQISKTLHRQLAVAFYDVTTYYFESVQADDMKKFGFSKDNKVNQVQVVMGLLIDEKGIPVSYDLFPGNTNDFRTLEPVLTRIKAEYGISKLIIVADRGLNSKKNLLFLKSLGFDYVMGYKIRSGSKQAKEIVLNPDGYTYTSPLFKWKTCDFVSSFRQEGQKHTIEDQLLITWSHKRQEKDRKDRERIVAKSQRLVDSKSQMKAEMKKGGKKYVQLTLMEEDQISFNDKQLEIDEQFDGYYGLQYSDPSMTTEEILNAYHGLWKIEESFRILKTNFEARPIFVWSEKSIQGHFVICYLALVIQRILEYKLKQKGVEASTEKIQDAIRSATFSQINMENEQIFIKNQESPLFSEILGALNLKKLSTYGRVHSQSRAYIQPEK